MSEPDDFAQGLPQAIQDTERNPGLDSGPIKQHVGPHSPVDEIVAFGRSAWADVLRGAHLEFHGTLNVIKALHWLKLRIADGEDFGHEADRIGVKRSYAYELWKLYEYLPELQTWGETFRLEHGEYPSRRAMLCHCGVGLKPEARRGRPIRRDRWIARMQHEIGRLRAALSESEVQKAELQNKLVESDAEVARLLAQFAATSEQSGADKLDSHSRGPHGQPLDVRFPDGRTPNFGGRTGAQAQDSGERETPEDAFARYGARCTFDVAATAENALCRRFFTKEDDALSRPWPRGEVIWLNCPYDLIAQFAAKAVEYVETGGGEVIALLPHWSDRPWYYDYASLGHITVIRRRLKFGGLQGISPLANIIVHWTKETVRDARERRARRDDSIVVQFDDPKSAKPPPQATIPSTAPSPRYWLTPPVVYEILDSRPGGYTDVCPHPLPPGFDALAMTRWPGKRCYGNVPYRSEDELHGKGKLAWARKAIEQNRLYGTEVSLLLPIFDYEYELMAAGAQMLPLGRIPFLEVDTKQPARHPPCTALFTLPGREK